MIKELELPGLPFIERLLGEAECELWQSAEDPKDSYRWTFMYNDSVESYVLLENVSITGEYEKEELCVDLRLLQTEDRRGISGRQQQSGVAFCVWFNKATFRAKLYSYHEIGHFWIKGWEQWRQLVYELGIIEDKKRYISEISCSQAEISLLDVLEFAPIRSYYAVPWEEGVQFSTNRKGVESFSKLLQETMEEASTKWQQKANRTLQKVWNKFLDDPTVKREKTMEHLLGTKKGIGIYQTLRKQIIEASSIYGSRDFGEKANSEIVAKRKELEKMLCQKGWKGSYPDFHRMKGFSYKQIHFVEEQPFTTEEFQYVFHGMVSYCGRLRFRKMKKQLGTDAAGRLPVNFGFFKGCGKGKLLRFPIRIENLD